MHLITHNKMVERTAIGTLQEIMKPEILSDIFETKVNIVDSPYGPIAIYY